MRTKITGFKEGQEVGLRDYVNSCLRGHYGIALPSNVMTNSLLCLLLPGAVIGGS